MSKLIDMTGWIMKEHGVPDSRLTVVERAENKSNGSTRWRCRCECGNEVIISGSDIRSGKQKSCGCLHNNGKIQQQDIQPGDKFGKLTILEKLDKRIGVYLAYKCQCECGNIIEVSSNSLRCNHTISCGCIKSKGEMKISQILRDNNISFEKEKIFDDCYSKKENAKMRFDFYVNNEYLIEYDGKQHFTDKNVGWNNESLEKIQQRDSYKNQYCKDNNIPLIRIPYTRFNELCLKDLLLETSEFLLETEEN